MVAKVKSACLCKYDGDGLIIEVGGRAEGYDWVKMDVPK